jgi:EmrB/QacA subfamily drug resistance transporter
MPAETAQPPQRAAIAAVMLPLMLVLFIATLDQTIVATALGAIGAALGDRGTAPWIATAYLLTSAVTTLIFGKLGDMYGRKPIFQWSVAIFVGGSMLCAVAPSMLWLILFRAIQGLGGGGLSSLAMAIVGDLVSARERARYQAILGIVPAIALILGPVLGGFIVDRLSWPWIFLINVPIGVFAFITISARLHLPRRENPHRIDFAGGILATLFTTTGLLVTVIGGHGYAWLSWQVFGLAAVALTALIVYLWVEHHAAEPITPLRLFRDRVFSIASALFFLSTAILFVGMLFVPMMLQSLFGLSAFAAGACIIPLLIGLVGATMATGNTIPRTGRYKRFPVIGALFCIAALAALCRLSLQTPLWAILVALTLLGAGIGLFIQVILLAGQNAVASKDLGVATGALNFFKSFGGAAGAAVFGAILTAATPGAAATSPVASLAAFHAVYGWAILLMGVALLLALLLEERPLSEETIMIAEGKIDVPEY